MKQFSDDELNIIQQIYDHKDSRNYVLTNVFEDILYGKGIAFDLDNGGILYEFENHDIDFMLSNQKEVINRALLIKYLEEEKYIYLINDESSVNSLHRVGDEIKEPIIQTLPTEIADILRRTTYRVLVDYSLSQFISNGYKTKEDIQIEEAQKQTKIAKHSRNWSIVATILAILTFLATVILPIITRIDYSEEIVIPISESIETNSNKHEANITSISTKIDSLINIENTINQQNKLLIKNPTKIYRKYYSIELDTINCDGQKVITIPVKTK